MTKTTLLILYSNLKRRGWLAGLVLALCFSFSTYSAQAQTAVKGKVTDEAGSGMPGVNILVKGTTNGTTSDSNGDYSLDVQNSDGVLVFSFIGYETQEQSLGGRSTIDVSLIPSIESLSEVVVVGYGTQKKIDLTGAVGSVSLEDLKHAPNTNLAQMMQGTVPGLNVGIANTAGGTPPISIRGQVTLQGSKSVLIILDGVQYTGSLSSINPDDVASIDVLKDASSTAVYGAQAANGVILISTKKGTVSDRPTVTFSSSYSSQTPTVGDLVPMNREQYLQGITDAWYLDSYTPESGYTQPNPAFDVKTKVDGSMLDPATGELLPNDFNWWDAGTNTGSIFENNLSISGGSEKATYLLSGGTVDQKGFIINDKFRRYTLRANLEIKPTTWWKIGLVSSGSFVNQDGAEPSLASLQRASPLHVPFDANGNLIPSPTNTIELNPFITYYVDDYDRHNYYFANVYTEIDIPFLKGLTYRMNFGNNYRTDKHYYASQYDNNGSGRAYRDDRQYYDYTFDNILSYKKVFGKHDVGVTLLYGAIERKYDRTYIEGSGFSRLNLSYNNLQAANNLTVNSPNDNVYAWQEQLLYQMARVNYKYDEKYLLTATVRRDGFSGFAKNNKFAVFPSVAGAWILSEEDFMQDLSIVNHLKLRMAYGESGNQTPRGTSLAQITTANATTVDNTRIYTAYVFGDGGNSAFGQQVSSLGNDDLKWERTKGTNIGVDATFFNNKTKLTLDFYNNNTYDLLYGVPVPLITGFRQIQSNLGQINNKGIEIALTQQLLNKDGFEWSATVNFSTNKNEIVSLTGQDLNADGKEDDLIPGTGDPTGGLFIGESIGTIYYFEPGPIYDMDDTRLPGFQIGTQSFVDQDDNNDITAADRVILGSSNPAYRFSVMSNLFYKGFNFSFLINSVQGGKDGFLGISAPTSYNDIPMYYREDNTIRWNDFKNMDYWSPSNPNGKYPRNIAGVRSRFDGRPFEDRSFVRLQDVSLSYDFKFALLKNVDLKSVNLFISAKNLQTWTKWEGFDPESNQTGMSSARPNDPFAVGIVAGGRPILRAFTMGLSITY